MSAHVIQRTQTLPAGHGVTVPVTVSAGLQRAARWLLPLALVALAWWWLIRHADLAHAWIQAQRLPPGLWLAATLALLGGHGLRAWRLRAEWQHRRTVPWGVVWRLVLTHNAAVLLMPLRAGEAGYLWLVHRTWGVGWREAARSLLWWRVQDATVLLVLALLCLLPLGWPARVLLALSALVTAATLAPWVQRRVDRLLLRRRPPRLPGPDGAGDVDPPGAARDPFAGFGIAAAIWLTKVLVLGGLVSALTGLDAAAGWRAALGGELGGVLPLQGPAGLGNYEAGAWLAVPGTGLSEAAGRALIGAVLTVHLFSLGVALSAATLVQFRGRRTAR